jgi:hypothetical protein
MTLSKERLNITNVTHNSKRAIKRTPSITIPVIVEEIQGKIQKKILVHSELIKRINSFC